MAKKKQKAKKEETLLDMSPGFIVVPISINTDGNDTKLLKAINKRFKVPIRKLKKLKKFGFLNNMFDTLKINYINQDNKNVQFIYIVVSRNGKVRPIDLKEGFRRLDSVIRDSALFSLRVFPEHLGVFKGDVNKTVKLIKEECDKYIVNVKFGTGKL